MYKKEYEMSYWKQYRLLEQEFLQSRMYVEFDVTNFRTISTAYIKMLLEIGSEVDNVMREMCSLTGRSNITDYAVYILGKYPNIVSQKVTVIDSSISIIPFIGWNTSYASQSLSFWQAYNHIKHDRIANRVEASFENVLNALGGLFILEMYRFSELYVTDVDVAINMPEDDSKIFLLDAWETHMRPLKIRSSYPIFNDDNNKKKLL